MTHESVKQVLNTFAGYETYHEIPSFSINDARDATENWISVFPAIQDLKYHVSPDKPVMRLRKFMEGHKEDYVKDSCLEGIHFTQDENTDVSLKHCLWLLKFQGATQTNIQENFTLHCMGLKNESPIFEHNTIP